MIEAGPFAGHYAGHYRTILADPPWRFITYDRKKAVPGQGADPYPTMSMEELAALPLVEIAAPDCALVLWYPGSMTDQVIELATKGWGFKFIRSDLFVWIKDREQAVPRIGPGYWSRTGAEICALFTRGKPRVLAHNVEQVIFCRRGPHSAKPEEQYERIEAMCPPPYLELFPRRSRRGWAAWGNETTKFDGLFEREL